MPYSTKTISATGLVQITSGARDVVSTAVVTISGFTGSLTFQSRHNNDGNGANTLVPGNVGYSILGGASVAAGTAITTDGRFEVVTDGSDLYFNVTAITGSFTYYLTSLQGGGGGAGSGGGGGGGGASTIANGADVAEGSTTDAPAASPTTTAAATTISLLKQIANNTSSATSSTVVPTTTVDPTNSFTQPTGDAAGRSIFMVAQGLVADGSTGTTSAAVLIGGLDPGGLVRTAPVSLASVTPVTTATYGIQTNSVIFGNSSANILRPLQTATGFGTSSSGSGALMVCEARAAAANAGSYEPVFNNLNTSILATGARTTTQTSADQTNPNHRGLKIVLDMTTVGTGSVTIAINGKDLNSGKYYAILTGAAVTTNSTNVYTIYPGATAVGNTTVNDVLPRLFQVVVTANNANTATYSVSYSLIV